MPYIVYFNKRNPRVRVRVHVDGCNQPFKNGGEHKYDQGGYQKFSTYADALEFARSKGASINNSSVGPCFFCKPDKQ